MKGWGWAMFIEYTELVDPRQVGEVLLEWTKYKLFQGFIKDDKIIVESRTSVKVVHSIRWYIFYIFIFNFFFIFKRYTFFSKNSLIICIMIYAIVNVDKITEKKHQSIFLSQLSVWRILLLILMTELYMFVGKWDYKLKFLLMHPCFQYMSFHSSFFASLFSSNSIHNNKNEFKLEDVSAKVLS